MAYENLWETYWGEDWSLLEFNIHDRLRKALDLVDISHAEMAEFCGVSRFTISRYINGATDVPVGVVRLWSMRTGVPFEWLMTGKTPDGNNPGGGEECAIRDLNPEPTDQGLKLVDLPTKLSA